MPSRGARICRRVLGHARPHRVSGLVGLVRGRPVRRVLGLVILGSRALAMASARHGSMEQLV